MDRAVAALQTAVREMDERFRKFSKLGARNLESYIQLTKDKPDVEKLPYLILVVDELADLMMVAADEVEKAITRLAQMARATGIHLVLATQRPSVDVVTGLIKANFPSRISFAVTSQIDSRVVLDSPGAEKLLGRGDMLYMASDSSKLSRLQGCFVSDRELDLLVNYWKDFVSQPPTPPSSVPLGAIDLPRAHASPSSVISASPQSEWVQGGLWADLKPATKGKSEEDELLEQAVEVVRTTDRASISLLQRKLRIGYSRAAKLMDLLEQKGYVGPDEGSPSKGREILKRETAETAMTGTTMEQTPPRQFEEVEGNDPSYDDWTEEDWADLDKG
jgi:DNA segregation ATPase FtsK/SpoIIIE, S-DNA-T family